MAPEGWRFSCIEDIVLQHGKVYEPRPAPFHPIPKACYHRAYTLATPARSKWIYVEGYAMNGPFLHIPVQHAWLTRADDPTGAYELAWEGESSERVYIGIPVRKDHVKEMHRKSKGQWYSVFDSWWAGYPHVSGEIPIEDVIDR
jgi:hypothetical protein